MDIEDELEPERRLWTAVVALAITDLHDPNDQVRQSAERFFAGRIFDLVGDAAGLEPKDIARLRDGIKIGYRLLPRRHPRLF